MLSGVELFYSANFPHNLRAWRYVSDSFINALTHSTSLIFPYVCVQKSLLVHGLFPLLLLDLPIFCLWLFLFESYLLIHYVSRLCVAYMDSAWRLLQLVGSSIFTDDQQRLCLYAALLLPFRNTVYKDKKGKKIPVVSDVFRTSLKLKSSDAETVIIMHLAAKNFISLIPSIVSNESLRTLEVDWKKEIIDVSVASKLRILAGLLLRDIKEFWRAALVLSLLVYPEDIVSSINLSNEEMELNERRGLFNRVENAILEMGLEKVWELKPLVNGKEIMSILQLKSGGPIVREWQQKLLEWQLAHPSGSAEECIDWMKEAQSKRARIE